MRDAICDARRDAICKAICGVFPGWGCEAGGKPVQLGIIGIMTSADF